MNIRNVLVPVDFSPPSRLAVDYAVSLARKFRAKLTLMHVVESPSMSPHPFKSESARIDKSHREQALRMLSALIASEDQDDLDLRTVIKSGDIKDGILSTIAEQQADVTVMGTHGRNFFGRLVIGSITEAILRKISIPVLTVCRATRPLAFKRILFATDLLESSRQPFSLVLDIAQRMDSDVTFLHALDSVGLAYSGPMVGYVGQQDIEQARTKLAEFAAEANARKVKTEIIIAEGLAAEEILKTAGENESDLVVMTVRRKGLMERTLLGTTAERVIRESNVPVLSIPATLES
jgi:nucleotide-binding universal stress UspA family protein